MDISLSVLQMAIKVLDEVSSILLFQGLSVESTRLSEVAVRVLVSVSLNKTGDLEWWRSELGVRVVASE